MKWKYEFCSMQVLIVAATSQEILPLISTNNAVDVLITGVGVPATLFHLQKRLNQIDYDFVIQAGIAGSYSPIIKLGEVVSVKADTFADIGMEEKESYTTLFQSGLADKDAFPFENGWLINNNILSSIPVRTVKAITINKLSDSKLQKQQFNHHFSPDIESMEGAALHYVCLQFQLPFLQLRSISNIVGERDKTKWKIHEAIDNLNNSLFDLLNQLDHNMINQIPK